MDYKNRELVALSNVLYKYTGCKTLKASYGFSKNLHGVSDTLEAFNELNIKYINDANALLKDWGSLGEYESKRTALVKSYARKDENGNPLQDDIQYLIDDVAGLNVELVKLNGEYSEKLNERKEILDKIEALNELESSFEPYMMTLTDLPEDLFEGKPGDLTTLLKFGIIE